MLRNDQLKAVGTMERFRELSIAGLLNYCTTYLPAAFQYLPDGDDLNKVSRTYLANVAS